MRYLKEAKKIVREYKFKKGLEYLLMGGFYTVMASSITLATSLLLGYETIAKYAVGTSLIAINTGCISFFIQSMGRTVRPCAIEEYKFAKEYVKQHEETKKWEVNKLVQEIQNFYDQNE